MGFLEILESYVVIDNRGVQKMRERIFIENPLMTSQERSRKLIQQIQQEINKNLQGVEKHLMAKLRTLVLHRSVKDNNILVTYSDIIHSMAELNMPLESTINSIKGWYELHLRGSEVSIIQLIDYIKVIQVYEEPIEIVEEVLVEEPEQIVVPKTFTINKKVVIAFSTMGLIAILVGSFMSGSIDQTNKETDASNQEVNTVVFSQNSISFANVQELLPLSTIEAGYFNEIINLNDALASPGIPEFLTYHPVDKAALQAYLKSRNSILAESPYFEGILSVSKEYDLHPLLMFAITGQEQGYVNKDNPNHLKIANNPFNVYTSWRKYNTDIEDSTAIAAGTVVTILRKRPENENPFKWINTRYAEDKNWARGVEMIFNFLMQYEL